jgi:hypothetical protein
MTRDEFNQMLDQHGIVFVGDAAWRVAQLVAAAEREACAKVCDQYAERRWDTAVAEKCAAAIRAGMQA